MENSIGWRINYTENGSSQLLIFKESIVNTHTLQKFILSDHVIERASERKITEEQLAFVLANGKMMNSKKGNIFHFITDKQLTDNLKPHFKKNVRSLIVITDKKSKVVITTYRGCDKVKNLILKSI